MTTLTPAPHTISAREAALRQQRKPGPKARALKRGRVREADFTERYYFGETMRTPEGWCGTCGCEFTDKGCECV